MDDNKKVLTWSLIGAGVLIIVIFAWYLGKNSAGPAGLMAGQAGKLPPSTTRQAVPSTIAVPDTASSVPANVAKPQMIVSALTGSSASSRSFSIVASGNKFTPDTVIVKVGDRVRLNIKAVDKDYDFIQIEKVMDPANGRRAQPTNILSFVKVAAVPPRVRSDT